MNIKNFVGLNSVIDKVTTTSSVAKSIKSEGSSADRDANGQSHFEKQKKRQKMTREQAEKALIMLETKPFMKDMNWAVSLIDDHGFFYAHVVDQNQNTVRKISEHDLWELIENPVSVSPSDHLKGNLLKRSA